MSVLSLDVALVLMDDVSFQQDSIGVNPRPCSITTHVEPGELWKNDSGLTCTSVYFVCLVVSSDGLAEA
ncbi:hypothetical protein NDU88_007748 [Pleurodeles waltl]|uniref:Uncharacterized protein n=1 Tax=Pleurodeles waltl TaxID=8319 RepID=A0AAV7U2F8_PLEWA|nr:hypothetical protein NDU88_007748 [Pleurodeles waltl]